MFEHDVILSNLLFWKKESKITKAPISSKFFFSDSDISSANSAHVIYRIDTKLVGIVMLKQIMVKRRILNSVEGLF